MKKIKEGDIVQIMSKGNSWFECLIVVTEVEAWGVQGYLLLPPNSDGKRGVAIYRVPTESFEKVGSVILARRESEEPVYETSENQYETKSVPFILYQRGYYEGWEVYAYTEYGTDGTPRTAKIRRQLA